MEWNKRRGRAGESVVWGVKRIGNREESDELGAQEKSDKREVRRDRERCA